MHARALLKQSPACTTSLSTAAPLDTQSVQHKHTDTNMHKHACTNIQCAHTSISWVYVLMRVRATFTCSRISISRPSVLLCAKSTIASSCDTPVSIFVCVRVCMCACERSVIGRGLCFCFECGAQDRDQLKVAEDFSSVQAQKDIHTPAAGAWPSQLPLQCPLTHSR